MTVASQPQPANRLDRKVATIGLGNHGKTVFLSSLFYDSFYTLARYFEGFTIDPANDNGIRMFYDNAETLRRQEIPSQTTANRTPEPAILDFVRVPVIPWLVKQFPTNEFLKKICAPSTVDIRLAFYDIAGEHFQTPAEVKRFAPYIEEADDILFLFDPTDPDFNALVGARLVDTVVSCYNQSLKKNVILVVTKMDKLRQSEDFASELQEFWPDRAPFWPPGYVSDIETDPLIDYLQDMQELSERLRNKWWRSKKQGASALINKLNPATTHYCAISSLGETWTQDKQTGDIVLERLPEPFRVRDPLFWIFKAAGAL